MSDYRDAEMKCRIEEERLTKYRGTASVKLTSLRFQASDRSRWNSKKGDAGSHKKKNREERGCHQEDAQHRAIAVISQEHLDTSLKLAALPAARLLADCQPYPELELPPHVQLDCLYGQDRILAACDALVGTEKRW